MTDSHTSDYNQTAHLIRSPDSESKDRSTNYDSKLELMLTAEQDSELIKAFKIGILKQLHSKKLVTDSQLHQLIALQQ